MIERIAAAFEIDRERDSTVAIAAPEPRPGLEASFEPSVIEVRVNLPSAERAAALTAVRKEEEQARDTGSGPAPLVEQRPAKAARRPLSYTAISAHDETGAARPPDSDRALRQGSGGEDGEDRRSGARDSRARAARVEPGKRLANAASELVRRISRSGEVVGSELAAEALLAPFQAWLDSGFFAERVLSAKRSRAEVPLLIEVAGTVLRGSIDLLVEEEGKPPLIVDYKTDRVDGAETAALVARYEIQQAIYALAVAEARGVHEVELAYVFLERPEEPVLTRWGPAEIEAGRRRLETEIARVREELIKVSGSAEPASFVASSSSLSSFRPSPTASSSAVQ